MAATVSGFSPGELAITFAFAFESGGSSPLIITDDVGGNTWTKQAESTQSGTFRAWCALFSSVLVNAPASVSIAETGFPSTAFGIVVLRVTGADTSSPLEGTPAASTATADDPTSSSVTTAAADTILVAGLCHDGADTTFDPPASWTMAQEQESNADQAYAVAYRIVSAPGTYSATWVTGASRDYGMTIAAFKAASAAAAVPYTPSFTTFPKFKLRTVR